MLRTAIPSAVMALAFSITAFAAESVQDVIPFEYSTEPYKLVKIQGETALAPQTLQEQEAVGFIRQVLDAPVDSDNLSGRKSSADSFLMKAASTKDFMVILYHKDIPIGFARVTKLTELIQIDPEGKFFPFATREHLTNKGYSLNAGYFIAGELALSYRHRGYMSKVAPTCADYILKYFIAGQENPYFFITVFNENIAMNKLCQNLLKCELLNENDTFSPEHNRQLNEYVYLSQSKK